MGMYDRAMSWGYKQGLKGIEKQMQKVIKKKRLVFLGDNNILYTDKKGEKHTYNLNDMVAVSIENGGWQKQMDTLGITYQDIKNILLQEYKKQKEHK